MRQVDEMQDRLRMAKAAARQSLRPKQQWEVFVHTHDMVRVCPPLGRCGIGVKSSGVMKLMLDS